MRRRAGVAIIVVTLVAGACGIGDRQHNADRIQQAQRRFAQTPTAAQLTLELELDRRIAGDLEGAQREQLAAALESAEAAGNPTLVLHAALDGTSSTAQLATDATLAEPVAVFVDSEVYARRRNARSTERRTWARLDLAELENRERRIDTTELTAPQVLAAVASTVNPNYLVELVQGSLAGSVAPKGTEDLGGVSATRYDVNISLDKAMTDLHFDDDQRLTRLRLFWLIGASGDVVPASVWLDDEGQLRRLVIEFRQRVTRQRSNKLRVTLDLADAPSPVKVAPPDQDVTVSYERFGRLVRSVLPPAA